MAKSITNDMYIINKIEATRCTVNTIVSRGLHCSCKQKSLPQEFKSVTTFKGYNAGVRLPEIEGRKTNLYNIC